ncbi:MAG: aspartate dehydrogenase [Candidatus Bathyarchaeota archaeon]|nr:aspartate dehydrogenase [Candidatus Bathyarchaeota archaeon]
MVKVGLIGCGAIGTVLAQAIERKLVVCDELVVFDTDAARAQKLKRELQFRVKIASSVDELLAAKPKVVVEAAGQQAVRDYYDKLVASNAQIIIMSTGALLALNVDSPNVHFPAGAIGGLDAIAAAANAGIDEITLTTRKNPKALGKTLTEEATIYEGYAKEAARQFPKEMNVAATLALTVKPVQVKVKVVADPKVTRNTHEIYVKWRFGEMNMRFANDPHPDNPHTSALAAWAAIRLLQTLLDK